MEDACVIANADFFVRNLPNGYDEIVGERATLLSGGQKQRIAIARAIVSDPKILLLDEATSALDSEAEGIVQNALDKASMNRTTITIAHRLSTIKNAHSIIVLAQGKVVEQGTHDELLSANGAYSSFVTAQSIVTKNRQDRGEEDVEKSDEVLPESADLQPALVRSSTGRSVASQRLENQSLDAANVKVKLYGVFQCIVRITGFQKREWPWLVTGAICSIIGGAVYPVQAIVFARLIDVFTYQGEELQSRASFWSLMFTIIAIVEGIAYYGIGKTFVYTSEKLTRRLRYMYFQYTLRQDIEYFDEDIHTTGALISSLNLDPQQIQQLVGSNLGLILVVIVNLVGGIVVSLAYGWKLALVVIFGGLPFIFAAGYLRLRLMLSYNAKTKKQYESSANFACEAASAIRTVASLTREEDVCRIYEESLKAPAKAGFRMAVTSTLWFSGSESIALLVQALGFWYGSTLVTKFEYSITQMFTVFVAIVFGAQSAGQFFSFTPNLTKAKSSVNSFLKLYDSIPHIDIWSTEGSKIKHLEGNLEFRDVHFRYRTRPHVPVLRGLNISIKAGQTVALVGHSGCGKTSVISLIERFYDGLEGDILVDGMDIKSLNLADYRSHLALVSQEPTLYQGTGK